MSNSSPSALAVANASAITPIILAGGASTRMGRIKALLDFDGKCCLELVLEAVRGLGTPVVVLGSFREEIQQRVSLGGVHVVWNEVWQRGQTSSLKAGLSRLAPRATAFLLYPVDFPLVSANEVGRLVDTYLRCQEPTRELFIPAYGNRHGHPVLCRRSLAWEFLALPDDAPARSVTKSNPERILHVPFDLPYVVMDLDTPEDYAACLAAYQARELGRIVPERD